MRFSGQSKRFLLAISPLVILLLLLSQFAGSSFAQQEPNRVDAEISESGITMPDTLPAGLTYLYVTNTGSTNQNFHFVGPEIDRTFDSDIMPGHVKLMVLNLQSGDYQVSNPLDPQGMPLEITVSEGGESEVTGTPGLDDDGTVTPAADDVVTGTPGEGEVTGTPGPDDGTGTPAADDAVTGTPGADEEQVPVTGSEHAGFSVAEIAQPGTSGEIDLEIQLVQIAEGFNDPVNVVSPRDGSGRLFVVERSGVIRIVQDGEVLEQPFLDLSGMTLDAFLEAGMYDLEFHPDFANNGRFYVHFAEILRNGDGMIVEYTVSADDENIADMESARVIMIIEQPWANHNGGELAFGPDGYLYIGSGDGGWEGDPLNAGQDLSTLLGKLLRIDVDTSSPSQPYGIPEDNPFVQEETLVQLFNIPESEFAQLNPTARSEIWAYGLRNPWKFHFDPETGDLYLPDVGQNHWEEINFQPADSQGGENYGWKFLMGTHCFPIDLEECPNVGVLPVAEYDHDQGTAIVGLGVYRGSDYPEMDGIYFVGDWGSGRIWGLQQGDDGEWVFDELLQTGTRITGGGPDENGTIYVTTCFCEYDSMSAEENQPGFLWQLVPADQVPEDAVTPPGGGVEEQETTPTPGTTGTPGVTGTPAAGTPTPGAQTGTPAATGEAGAGGAASEDELVQQGEQVFTSTCASCHGNSGQGGIGPALAGDEFVVQEPPDPVIDIVLNGMGQMPAFRNQLETDQIAAVISFIRNMWGNEASIVTPEQVEGAE